MKKISVNMLSIADTVKGKGISFLENQPKSHHCALTKAQYEQAKAEIEQA